MKDVYEILRLKENEISRLEVEVEALRVVAPLLSDDEKTDSHSPTASVSTGSAGPIRVPEATNPKPQPDHSPERRSRSGASS
jgi:hypothetical protein